MRGGVGSQEGAAVGVHALTARRLADVAVYFERRHDGVDVAGRERRLVFGHDVRLAEVRSVCSGGRFACSPVSRQPL
jgi:hypothetical protein